MTTNWSPKFDGGFVNWAAMSESTEQAGVSSVHVSPVARQVAFGATLQMAARVYGTGEFSPEVAWTLESGGGTLTADGLYTAGASPETVVIRATSVEDPTVFADATLTIAERVFGGVPGKYAARIGGRLVTARDSRELLAEIEAFEAQAQERAERKAAAEALKERPRTPRRLAKSAPQIEDISAPDADQAALQAMVEAANERIRATYEQAAQAQMLEQRLTVEMSRRAQQDAEDMEAIHALEGL